MLSRAGPGVRRVRSPGGHRGRRKVVGSEPQPPPEPEPQPPGRGPPSGDPARPSDPPSSAARVALGSGAAAGAAGGRREPGGCMMRCKHRAPGLCGAPCRAEVTSSEQIPPSWKKPVFSEELKFTVQRSCMMYDIATH
ncbi:vasodilator-stimulated phosphoprotein-like [Eubalaena glacialis]|uniref:vasodilator-stimulated phosphoprotein-like n=1 Tax=Eubalaena glacialis TaxID=27606 RepID=UPI002A5ACB6D|nr:vasodilator-stimulated phosphoprotein-like [Eubalaena glacialis]